MIAAVLTVLTDADRVADIVVLITCAMLVVWFLLLSAIAIRGADAKEEDDWLERHIREVTAATGRRSGR